ncbi:MAG: peptidase MA family metallohydrolase [bacterium]
MACFAILWAALAVLHPALTAWAQSPPLVWEKRALPGIQLEYTPRDRILAGLLEPALMEDRKKVMERLRMFPQKTLRVIVAPTREAFEALTGAVPGQGTLGVYLLGRGVIVVRAPRTDPGGGWDPRGVLRHELAHAVIDLSIGQHVPLWLHEGLAIQVAGELDYLDETRLTLAAVAGQLIPLEVLMHRFPGGHRGRALAYAQAASFVRFLTRREGMGGIQRLLDLMKKGTPPTAAFSTAYGARLAGLEAEWQSDLTGRFSYWSLVTSSTLLGGLGIPLVLVAVLRRWLQKRRKFRQWEAEEQARAALTPGGNGADGNGAVIPGNGTGGGGNGRGGNGSGGAFP